MTYQASKVKLPVCDDGDEGCLTPQYCSEERPFSDKQLTLLEFLPLGEICMIMENYQGSYIFLYWYEFVKNYLRTGKSENTVRNVRDTLRFVYRFLNIVTVEQINDCNLLDDALHKCMQQRGFTHSTFNSYRKNINTFMLWLERRGYIEENKVRFVDKCKEIPNEQHTLTQDQVDKIVAVINTRRQKRLERYRNTLFIDLLRFTGARPCELLEIKLVDILCHNGQYKLVIRGKKQKGRVRYYNCPSFIRDRLITYTEYRRKFRPKELYLFVSSSKQGKWTEKGMRGLFKQLSTEVGFRVTAYGFRRYVASKLSEQGQPLNNIREYLGHTRVTTTLRYIEKTALLTQEASEAMAKLMELGENADKNAKEMEN